jgi:hypothetical protein
MIVKCEIPNKPVNNLNGVLSGISRHNTIIRPRATQTKRRLIKLGMQFQKKYT